jgi:hypothetical protein
VGLPVLHPTTQLHHHHPRETKRICAKSEYARSPLHVCDRHVFERTTRRPVLLATVLLRQVDDKDASTQMSGDFKSTLAKKRGPRCCIYCSVIRNSITYLGRPSAYPSGSSHKKRDGDDVWCERYCCFSWYVTDGRGEPILEHPTSTTAPDTSDSACASDLLLGGRSVSKTNVHGCDLSSNAQWVTFDIAGW